MPWDVHMDSAVAHPMAPHGVAVSGPIGEAAAGAFIAAPESLPGAGTVTSRVSFNSMGGRFRLRLAGLSSEKSGEQPGIALAFEGQAGFFGLIGTLQLEIPLPRAGGAGTAGEAEPMQESTFAPERLTLAENVRMQLGKTYEATLSFDGARGIASVRLISAADHKEVFSGTVYLEPASLRDLYPGAGVRQLSDAPPNSWTFTVSQLEASPEFVRVGRPVGLPEHVPFSVESADALSDGSPSAVAVLNPSQPVSLTVGPTGPGLVGALQITATDSLGNERLLWSGKPGEDGQTVVLPPHSLGAGTYVLHLYYTEPDFQVSLNEESVKVVDTTVRAMLTIDRNQPWETDGRITGALELVADRSVENVEVRVLAIPQGPPGKEAAETVVWRRIVDFTAMAGERFNLDFSVPESRAAYAFRVEVPAEEAIHVDAAYRVPRTLYVSPNGNDAWSGTFDEPSEGLTDGPLRTIAGARDAIRSLKARGFVQGPVQILIRGGTYRLDEPIVFTPDDSGSETAPIRYEAYPGERPVITGAVPVDGWVPGEGGVWKAPAPPPFDPDREMRILQVGDTWATRARYPNADPDHPVTGGWAFAKWWGPEWERGRFGWGVRSSGKGDELVWGVEIPADGKYDVWVRYASSSPIVGGLSLGLGGQSIPFPPIPPTGGVDAFLWSKVATVDLKAGPQTVAWTNTEGRAVRLDALFITNNRSQNPENAIEDLGRGDYRVVRPFGDRGTSHHLVIQAEAAEWSTGRGLSFDEIPRLPGVPDRLVVDEGVFPNWSDWSGARVDIYPAFGYNNAILDVTRVDPATRTLWLAGNLQSQAIRPGNRFFIFGTREALDAPGEWHFDPESGEVLYLPAENDFPDVQVVSPVLDRLVVFKGDPLAGRYIEHVELSGLVFTGTTYTRTGYHIFPPPADAAVWLSGARGVTIRACTFEYIGGYAVRLEQFSRDNRIIQNHIRYMGEGGVILLGDTVDQPTNNLIAANDIHDGGKVFKHSMGVWLRTGSGNRIVHNRIVDMPRYAISIMSLDAQASSHDNVVAFNDIRNVVLETTDAGGIETLGRDQQASGNVIKYNFISNVVGIDSTEDGTILRRYFTWSIYLDDYSSDTTVYGNIVVGAADALVNVHGGRDNTFENNIFVGGGERLVRLQPRDEFMKNNTFRRNVFVVDDRGAELWYSWPWSWSPDRLGDVDRNVYWHVEGAQALKRGSLTPVGSWEAWQSAGFDRHSLIADPKLVESDQGIPHPAPGSPAFSLGFEPIPYERIGPAGFRPEEFRPEGSDGVEREGAQ